MAKQYETVIGLEVHVELATKTKIFCGCSTAFGGAPNTHTCPVCTGMPGSLPVLNKQVVEYAMGIGLAEQTYFTFYITDSHGFKVAYTDYLLSNQFFRLIVG